MVAWGWAAAKRLNQLSRAEAAEHWYIEDFKLAHNESSGDAACVAKAKEIRARDLTIEQVRVAGGEIRSRGLTIGGTIGGTRIGGTIGGTRGPHRSGRTGSTGRVKAGLFLLARIVSLQVVTDYLKPFATYVKKELCRMGVPRSEIDQAQW